MSSPLASLASTALASLRAASASMATMALKRPFVASAGSAIEGDCLLLDTTSGLTSHFSSLVGFDPGFQDAGSGDLHISRSSPAVDSCDNASYVPLDSDYDLETRGYDFSSEPDLLGPFDRGADEVRPLFADGFASGNTVAWSATVP